MAKTATKKKTAKQPDLFDRPRGAKSSARKAPKASTRGKTGARSKASARGTGAEAGYTAKHIEVLEGLERSQEVTFTAEHGGNHNVITRYP
jgi:hypothetical protein